MLLPNKALHLTAIPLRSLAAGELGRSALGIDACTLHTLTSLSVTWSEP